ncbi:MAG: hypothetical protein GYA17_04145 [Chloroflexi bacterium]|nr:hypothetical protein [Chloroflexota bacterium]
MFKVFSLAPHRQVEAEKYLITMTDKRELNAGRVIGILERVIIYTFVLQGQYTAIGFILAAKSFARFKELDNREFAEYVLIGTLLSALLAMMIALFVGRLIM